MVLLLTTIALLLLLLLLLLLRVSCIETVDGSHVVVRTSTVLSGGGGRVGVRGVERELGQGHAPDVETARVARFDREEEDQAEPGEAGEEGEPGEGLDGLDHRAPVGTGKVIDCPAEERRAGEGSRGREPKDGEDREGGDLKEWDSASSSGDAKAATDDGHDAQEHGKVELRYHRAGRGDDDGDGEGGDDEPTDDEVHHQGFPESGNVELRHCGRESERVNA